MASIITAQRNTPTLDSLPPECVEEILLYLENDPIALARLLRVNHYLFKMTVPVLYRDPFKLIRACRPVAQVARVLLSSIPLHENEKSFSIETLLAEEEAKYASQKTQEQAAAASRLGCGNPNCQGTCRPAPIGKVKVETVSDTADGNSDNSNDGAPLPRPPSTMAPYADYLKAFNLFRWRYAVHHILTTQDQRNLFIDRIAYRIEARILSRICDQLESLEFIPRMIQPVIFELAPKMRSLKHVGLNFDFSKEELVPVIRFLRTREQGLVCPGQDEKGSRTRAGAGLETCNLPPMITKIGGDEDPHSQHHFHLPLTDPHHHHHHHFSLHLQAEQQRKQQLLELITAYGQPIELDAARCHDFSSIAHLIPCQHLTRLQKFKHVLGFLEGDGGRFLRRCRKMEDLDFAAFDKDVFSWAFIEKQKSIMAQVVPPRESASSSISSSWPVPASLPIPIPAPSLPPVNLRIIRIAISQWMTGRVLRSLLEGFSHSLESVLYNVYEEHHLSHVLCKHTVQRLLGEASVDLPYRLDRHLLMPKLKKLRLLRITPVVEIGPGAFDGCPELESLAIVGPASCIEGRQDYGMFRNPKLNYLELGPTAASRFAFESLPHLPKLESLALRDSILPEEEPEPTPIKFAVMPWTWTMPVLSLIQLCGRSSAQFRFHWISHCPQLHTLNVEGVSSAATLLDSSDLSSKHERDGADEEVSASFSSPGSSRYGSQLRICHLQFYQRQHQYNKFRIRNLLEMYCSHVEDMKLTGRLYPSSITTTSTTVPTEGRGGEWKQIDLDMALNVTHSLTKLKTLTLCPTGKPSVRDNHSQQQQKSGEPPKPKFWYRACYGLIRGTRHEGTKTPVWCRSVDLKPVHIELLDETDEKGNTLVFKQLTSWLQDMKKLVDKDFKNQQGHEPRPC
ncbi:hypothetical protein BGZ83_008814 [Gryganskiella cystojenkinii]|nr:hypothetical protein BGZ83_008814 [Gryganskiella cystojenkinii]